MKNTGVIIAIIAVLALAGGAFAFTRGANKPTDSSPTPTASPEATSATAITYSNDGFSPSTLTVKAGTTVTIKNNSSRLLQLDSNPHPDHTDNPELNVGTVSPGKSTTFVVTKTGSHGYHNHLNTGDTGTLIVE